jgi:hypothetical protein
MSERNHLINRRDAAPTPTGVAELIGYRFPIPHAPDPATLPLHTAMMPHTFGYIPCSLP